MNTLLFTSDGPYTLRDLKAADAPRVLELLRASALWLQKKKGLSQWSAYLSGGEELVAEGFREGLVLLAERGGKDAACLILKRQQPFWDDLGLDVRAAWIHTVVVQPEFMYRGVGKALLKFAETQAVVHKNLFLRLRVEDANRKLKAYFAKLDFKELGTKDLDGKTVRLMEKQIQ